MARIDDHTKKFMEDVSGKPEHNDAAVLDPLRTARFASKVMTDPKKAISKFLIAKATKEMSKEGSLNVIGLFGFLNDHYKREWWDWVPETLWKTLRDDHFSEGTPEELREAILALQVLVKTNAPFEDWHVFEKVGHAFNMNHVDFSILQPLEAHEAALTMHLMNRIRPKQEYEDEVLGYVAACARNAGMVYLPSDMFPGVQVFLDNLNFDVKFRDNIAGFWKSGTRTGLTEAESIQLSRLDEVSEYLKSGGMRA